MGGSVSLALEKQYKKECNNPYGVTQSKAFGAPVVSGKIGSCLSKVGKPIVNNSILYVGVAGGAIDSAIGLSDGGLLTGMGADIGEKISTDMANRLTEDIKTQKIITQRLIESYVLVILFPCSNSRLKQ